jgi:hypothetical protein
MRPPIRIKVKTEDGRFALLVPAVIDSDGETTITLTQAAGATGVLRQAAFPKTVTAPPYLMPNRRRHKKRTLTESGTDPTKDLS